jgi:hypothetical protein
MKISVSLLLLRIQEVFEERGAQENAGEARRDRGVSGSRPLAYCRMVLCVIVG